MAREMFGVSVKPFLESHLNLKTPESTALKLEANALCFPFFPGMTSLWGAGKGGFSSLPQENSGFQFFFFSPNSIRTLHMKSS